jgi:uncharacterized protein YhfF
VVAAGIDVPPGPIRLDSYGDSHALSEELLALIRKGKKRAGTSLLWAVEADGEALPEPSDIEIVLDFHDTPVLVTRIKTVEVVPFSQVTAAYAAIEGEGDGSLEFWRKGHWAFFGRECARIGRAPSEDMPVVCCVFELLSEVPRGIA